MSSTWPSQVMPGSRLQPAASCSLTEAGLAGSGVPAISSSTFEPRCAQQPVGARSACECPCRRAAGRRRRPSAGPAARAAAAALRHRRPSPGSARCVRRAMPSESMPSRSSGFCTRTVCLGRLSSRRSSALDDRPQQHRLGAARGEGVAEAGQRVDAAHRPAQRGERSEHRGLQRDMMRDVPARPSR